MASPDRVEPSRSGGVSGGPDGGVVLLSQPGRQTPGASCSERWPPTADGEAVPRVNACEAECDHAGERADEWGVAARSLAEADGCRQRHERDSQTVRVLGQPYNKATA